MVKAEMVKEVIRVAQDGVNFADKAKATRKICKDTLTGYTRKLASKYCLEGGNNAISYDFNYWVQTAEAHTKKELIAAYLEIVAQAQKVLDFIKHLDGCIFEQEVYIVEEGGAVEGDINKFKKMERRLMSVVLYADKGKQYIKQVVSNEAINKAQRDLQYTGIAQVTIQTVFYIKQALESRGIYTTYQYGYLAIEGGAEMHEYEIAKRHITKALADTVGHKIPVQLGSFKLEYDGGVKIDCSIPLMACELEAIAKQLETEFCEISENHEHMNYYTLGYILSVGETIDTFFEGPYWAECGSEDEKRLNAILEQGEIF